MKTKTNKRNKRNKTNENNKQWLSERVDTQIFTKHSNSTIVFQFTALRYQTLSYQFSVFQFLYFLIFSQRVKMHTANHWLNFNGKNSTFLYFCSVTISFYSFYIFVSVLFLLYLLCSFLFLFVPWHFI
jgi:hypothetical protein